MLKPFAVVVAVLLILCIACLHCVVESRFGSKTSSTEHHDKNRERSVRSPSQPFMNTYARYPISISRGSGVSLFDSNGTEYLDFASGIATCCLGHSNHRIRDAVCAQMSKIQHCSNLNSSSEQIQLAEWLVAHSCADKVFFCNSGAEANEAAIKLARKYAHTKRHIDYPVIITARNSFHGRTLTELTATGQPKYHKHFGALTPGFEYVEYNNVTQLRTMVGSIWAKSRDFDGRINAMLASPPDLTPVPGLAAIMIEVLQGEGGVVPASTKFYKEVRRLCDETGALMIIDEVQTGMGRTGHLWGYEHFTKGTPNDAVRFEVRDTSETRDGDSTKWATKQVRSDLEPDIITSAKALGGGVPIGAMLCKHKCDVFQPGDHASTFGGNPLACAAGLAVALAFEEDGVLDNVVQCGRQFRQLALQLKEKYPDLIADVRGWGLLNGIEFVTPAPVATKVDDMFYVTSKGVTAAEVTNKLLQEGVLVVPAGEQVVRFIPSLIVSEQNVTTAIATLDRVLCKILPNKLRSNFPR